MSEMRTYNSILVNSATYTIETDKYNLNVALCRLFVIRVARWLHSTIPREGVDNLGGAENNGKQPCAPDCHHGILPLPYFCNVEDGSEVDLVEEGTDHTCSEIAQTRKSKALCPRREKMTRINCTYPSRRAIIDLT